MEEERNTVQNKKSGKTVAIVILILIILGMGGYISYDKYFYKYFKKPEVKEKQEKTEETETIEKEETLTNFGLMNDINKKLKLLIGEGAAMITTNDMKYKFVGAGYLFNTKEKVTLEDIPNDYKLFMAISELMINNEDPYSESKVNELIKETYGDTFKYEKPVDIGCPYDITLKNGVYTTGDGCGGPIGPAHISSNYTYKMTTKDDEIYVYVAVSYGDYTDGNDTIDDDEVGIVFTNLEKDIYKDYKNFKKLDESNYKDFSKYKITFKKDSTGNYIFKESVRIEK